MFVIKEQNSIVHEDADCNLVPCRQLNKPDKIVASTSGLFHPDANIENKTHNMNTDDMAIAVYRDNVISISAAIKSAKQASAQKLRLAKFNYPMLECS